MESPDESLTPPAISARAAFLARDLLVARLFERPDDDAAQRALELIETALATRGVQLELALVDATGDPFGEWSVSPSSVLLAERLLVERLHAWPSDLAASRALKPVSDTLGRLYGEAARASSDRIPCAGTSPRAGAPRATVGEWVRAAWRGAAAQVETTMRQLPTLAGRAAKLLARGLARAARWSARHLGAWRRSWLSVRGLRRMGRAAAALGRRMAPVGVAVGVGCLTTILFATALFGSTQALGRLSVADAKVELRPLAMASTVYAADGSRIGLLGVEDREPVGYREIPRVLVDAVVATEDRTFWTNPGIDLQGLARAFVTNVKAGRVVQGGSTITEQLAKNRLLNPKRDAGRKAQQMLLALAINQQSSKRRILTQYLNTVYFGRGAYGVMAAARRYFVPWDTTGTSGSGPLRELTLGQAALLAGLIANPSAYDPFTRPDAARQRRHDVLERMLEDGLVTRQQMAAADAEPLPAIPPAPDLRPRDIIVDQVQQILLSDPRLGASPAERRERLLKGGLDVYTTIDPVAQAQAQDAIHAVLPDDPRFTAALVAMDPATGHVVAMVNGPSYEQLQYNLVTHTPGRQPGSTYKVITLAAALEAGYSPNDVVNGSSPCTATRPGYPSWSTANAEPGGGTLTLRAATAYSVNCAYAHVIASLGPPAVIDMAHRLGVNQPIPNYLPITLGASETTPLEMATVASTLAAGGIRHDPILVERVVAPNGKVLIDNTHPPGRRVLDPDIAACETDILRDVIARGTGTAARLPGIDAAGKTGTTDDHADAWFLGYTSNLATVVWMGAPSSRIPMTNVGGIEVFGGTYPARIWRAFMDTYLDAKAPPDMPDPGPVCARPGAFIRDAGRGGSVPVTPRPAPAAPMPTRPDSSAPQTPATPATSSPTSPSPSTQAPSPPGSAATPAPLPAAPATPAPGEKTATP